MINKEGMAYVEIEGVFDSVPEHSVVLISYTHEQHLFAMEAARRLALLFNQAAILEVDNEDNAKLWFTDKDFPIQLGTFKSVPKEVAIMGDHSYDGYNYYVVE